MTHASIDHLTGSDAILVEYDTRAGIVARRNVLLGLWAAAQMGLSGAVAEAYAWSVHFADLDEPGHDDVVGKVGGDLRARGIAVSEAAVRRQLREMEARAELHLASDIR